MKRRRAAGRAVFFDRDGVLIHEVGYLCDVKKLKIFPGAAAALKSVRAAGFRAVIVTNQSAIARGWLSPAGLRRIHASLRRGLAAQGARWDALYVAPQHPESRHPWRKPGIGMLEAARKRFGLDLKASYLIGDTTTDVQTARNAGCAPVLVRTGKGGRDGKFPRARPDKMTRDVATAVRWILAQERRIVQAGAASSSK